MFLEDYARNAVQRQAIIDGEREKKIQEKVKQIRRADGVYACGVASIIAKYTVENSLAFLFLLCSFFLSELS